MTENEKKQIEEMQIDLMESVVRSADNGEIRLGDTAKNLYDKNYRKQIEGEWIVCGMFDDFFKCSSCGDKHPWQTAIEYKYCPNCGAKMFVRMTHTCPHNIPNFIPTIEELLKGGDE